MHRFGVCSSNRQGISFRFVDFITHTIGSPSHRSCRRSEQNFAHPSVQEVASRGPGRSPLAGTPSDIGSDVLAGEELGAFSDSKTLT
mmetsp:Transcript_52045/g.136061  ORF Transcript_52045/g.136061 Transcript_52045/m.136061 type:complete len:87 (+) Transcript_52045:2834-3094(+)